MEIKPALFKMWIRRSFMTVFFFDYFQNLPKFGSRDFFFFGKKRNHVFIGVVKKPFGSSVHKLLLIALLAYNRIILMRFSIGFIRNISFFFQMPYHSGNRVVM